MRYLLVRSASMIIPLSLFLFLEVSQLADFLLFSQYLLVISTVSSSALISSFIRQTSKVSVNLFILKDRIPVSLLIVVCVLSAFWISAVVERNFLSIVAISLLNSFRGYYINVLKRYVDETHVILMGEVIYIMALATALLLGGGLEVGFLFALLITNYILWNVSSKIHSNAVVVINKRSLSENLQHLIIFSLISCSFPASILLLLNYASENEIVAIKLALSACTPLAWLNSSLKARFLQFPELNGYDAIKHDKTRAIFLSFLVCVIVVGFLYISELDVANFSKNLDTLVFIRLTVLGVLGYCFTIFVTLNLGKLQWQLYTGLSSHKVAAVYLFEIFCLFLFLQLTDFQSIIYFVFALIMITASGSLLLFRTR